MKRRRWAPGLSLLHEFPGGLPHKERRVAATEMVEAGDRAPLPLITVLLILLSLLCTFHQEGAEFDQLGDLRGHARPFGFGEIVEQSLALMPPPELRQKIQTFSGATETLLGEE